MDAAPPPPPPAAYAYAPGNIYPVTDRERALCESADHPDWLYLGGLVLLDVATVYQSMEHWKYNASEPLRLFGTGLAGLTFGATLGGGYLALPKCDPHWIAYAPREGDVRTTWPLAISIALASGVIGAGVYGVEVGLLPQAWSTTERGAHLFIAGGASFVGALIPYLLPPKTWRAAQELAKIRAGASSDGAFLGYALSF